jgi:hypothetical protein
VDFGEAGGREDNIYTNMAAGGAAPVQGGAQSGGRYNGGGTQQYGGGGGGGAAAHQQQYTGSAQQYGGGGSHVLEPVEAQQGYRPFIVPEAPAADKYVPPPSPRQDEYRDNL